MHNLKLAGHNEDGSINIVVSCDSYDMGEGAYVFSFVYGKENHKGTVTLTHDQVQEIFDRDTSQSLAFPFDYCVTGMLESLTDEELEDPYALVGSTFEIDV